jgi:hypothetical protein
MPIRLIITLFLSLSVWANDFEQVWQQEKAEFNTDELTREAKKQAEVQIPSEMLGAESHEVAKMQDAFKDKSIYELENEGRMLRAQNNENNKILDQLETNTNISTPGVKAHQEFAQKTAKEANTLLKSDMKKTLKEHGIDLDCSNIEGSAHLRDDPFVVGIEPEQIKDEVYEPKYCEHLMNVYDCKDDLEIHCERVSSRPEQMRIQSASCTYTVNNNVASFKQDYKQIYNNSSNSASGLFSSGSIFGSQKHTYHALYGTELTISFYVELDPPVFYEFALYDISHRDALFVQLNGATVFPGGWSTLYSTGSRERVHTHTSGNMVSKTKHFTHYPQAYVGYYIRVGDNNPRTSYLDLRPFLQKGYNQLVIKSLGIYGGQFSAKIKSYERLCLKWSEPKWNESCILRKY